MDVTQLENEEVSAITIGMPVYTSSSGKVKKAKADAATTKLVIGLVRAASIAAGATDDIQTDGVLSSSDWTAVTGAAALTAGSEYWLSSSTAGNLSTSPPPASEVGSYQVPVGRAISTTELEIHPAHRSVLL